MYDGTYALGGSLTVITGARSGPGDGWSWGQPTANLEQAYIDAGDTERLRWTIIKTGCTEIAGENNFDKFVENNTKIANYKDYIEKYGWDPECYIIDPSQHKSARIVRKYFVPIEKRPEVYNIDKIPLDHRILRYADVLLMYAEACNELGEDGTARTYLNEVRNRVKLPAVTSSGNELRKAIRLERRLELAWEQNRIYDIRRWTDDNGKKMICNLMGANGTLQIPLPATFTNGKIKVRQVIKESASTKTGIWYSRYLYMRLQCLMVLSPKIRAGINHFPKRTDCYRN